MPQRPVAGIVTDTMWSSRRVRLAAQVVLVVGIVASIVLRFAFSDVNPWLRSAPLLVGATVALVLHRLDSRAP
jgi:hypothetical protein